MFTKLESVECKSILETDEMVQLIKNRLSFGEEATAMTIAKSRTTQCGRAERSVEIR